MNSKVFLYYFASCNATCRNCCYEFGGEGGSGCVGEGGSGRVFIAVVDFLWEGEICRMVEILMVQENHVANYSLCSA